MSIRTLTWFLLVAALAWASADVLRLAWTCDDAYISFRYAENLVEGHGLIFNPGAPDERVEGYTNFAWTLLMAVGMFLGFTGDAVEGWAVAWGLLFHLGTLVLLAAAARSVSRAAGAVWIPVAMVGYAAHHHAASLAPAGLETAMFTFIGTAMLLLTVSARSPRHGWWLGVLGVLAAMTRPDGAIFCAAAGVVLSIDAARRRSWRTVFAYAAPFAVLYLPYFVWKWSYYGYPVPNTFYAKSASDPYPGQGASYLWEYLKCYWVLMPGLAALLWVALARTERQSAPDWSCRRVACVTALFVLPYLAFVVWVGGDFMFARFVLPVTPAVYLGYDLLRARLSPKSGAGLLLAAAVALGTVVRAEPEWLDDYRNEHGFSDNRAISVAQAGPYDFTWLEAYRGVGHYFRRIAEGLDFRIGISGSHANLAYRGRFPVVIECATGLTDEHIAHIEVGQRGPIGHEKTFMHYPGYLQSRGVQVTLQIGWRAFDAVDPYRDIRFASAPLPTPARLVLYDRELLEELKRRDPAIRYTPFEEVLDAYIADLPNKAGERVREDYEAFKTYYFDVNEDPERQEAFERFLKAR